MKKQVYIAPDVQEISIDQEISLQLNSLNDLPPEFENENVYNFQPGEVNKDPYRLA